MTDLLRRALAGSAQPCTFVSADPAMLEARAQIAEKFIPGEWGTDLTELEAARAADRESANTRGRAWRD